MKEMLFIDGQLVDLGEDTNITLNFKSNIFADLSKIVGNNSYTIRLPKTVKNMRIIGNADAPASSSEFPRSYHECRYFRNGVEIVSNGRAVLLSVGDAIEIAMAWGNTSGFAKLVEDGKNLNEVAEVNDYVTYMNAAPPFYWGSNLNVIGVGYVNIDMGLKSDETLAALHPTARFEYIVNLLQNTYGVTFEFPEDKLPFIQSLVFPLLTRNGGYANKITNKVNMSYGNGGWVIDSTSVESENVFEFTYSSEEKIFTIKALRGGKYVFTPNFKSLGLDMVFQTASISYIDGIDSTGEFSQEYFPFGLEADKVLPLSYMVYDEPIEIDLSDGGTFYLTTGGVLAYQNDTPTLSVAGKPTEIQIGDRYPIVENLPSIKTVDFIKAIASMLNMFAVPNEDGSVIKFVSVDDLADISRAYDWSDKLMTETGGNKPKNVSYALDDFARNNRFSYKEDDTVLRKYKDGNITVNDDTLDFERDAVELPFAASDTIGGKARIALYEYNDDGEPELQSVEPRVLREISVNGYSTGTFVGLSWGELIANYYGMFQRIVASPVVVVDNFLLNDIELKELDYTRPVYLRQYGRYFAIVEIKAPSNGVCECKLLELDL